MIYDIAHLPIALPTALTLGCVFGWWTRSFTPAGPARGDSGRAMIVASAFLLLAGAAVALAQAVPARPGLWLETALLLSAAYILGFASIGIFIKSGTATKDLQGTPDRPGSRASFASRAIMTAPIFPQTRMRRSKLPYGSVLVPISVLVAVLILVRSTRSSRNARRTVPKT